MNATNYKVPRRFQILSHLGPWKHCTWSGFTVTSFISFTLLLNRKLKHQGGGPLKNNHIEKKHLISTTYQMC